MYFGTGALQENVRLPFFYARWFLTSYSVCERLEVLGYDRKDIGWVKDGDWGKLFTEGGKINETCVYSRAHRAEKKITLLSDWRKFSLPSLKHKIAHWKESRKDEELHLHRSLQYVKFIKLLDGFLPEHSDLNPVHPPRVHWIPSAWPLEMSRQGDSCAPITRTFLEEHRGIILDVVTEYNRNLRADIIQMALANPMRPTKPIAVSEEKALVTLNHASTLFIKKEPLTGLYTSRLCTYGDLIKDIRESFRDNGSDIRFRYGGYHSQGWPGMLLEMLGLDGGVTWDVVDRKQEERPLVCLCGEPGFRQPTSFIDLVGRCYTLGSKCSR